MECLKNDKGLTLVEVIAGVVLISIILLSFFNFFTNAANFNGINNVKIQSTNIAREYTANVEEKYKNSSLDEMQMNFNFIKTEEDGKVLYKKIDYKNEYIIETIIYDELASTVSYRKLYPTKVVVWKDEIEGSPVSESITYHEGEVLLH